MKRKSVCAIVAVSVLWIIALPSDGIAAGPLGRALQQRSNPAPQLSRSGQSFGNGVTPASAQSRSTNSSKLPAGRNYYQGRYYGNFNNRFYGPQYGYF